MELIMEITKSLLIDAIKGKGFFTYADCGKMESLGLAKFTGNQHNEKWDWIPERLERLGMDELKRIYSRMER
jgi:hypothetical protein